MQLVLTFFFFFGYMFQVPNDKIKHKNKIISEEEWPHIAFGIPSPGFSKLMRCGGREAQRSGPTC
jgi:hypothetical protein